MRRLWLPGSRKARHAIVRLDEALLQALVSDDVGIATWPAAQEADPVNFIAVAPYLANISAYRYCHLNCLQQVSIT